MKLKRKQIVPLVMTAISIFGTAATVITAVKATPKAMELIQADSRKNHDGDPYAYTKTEAIESAWKCYIPTTLLFASTVICMVGAISMTRSRQTALIGAYSILNKTYKQYQNKVKEHFGEQAHQKIIQELAVEQAKDVPIYAGTFCGSARLDFEDAEEDTRLFYDSFSERYFKSTISKVLLAEYHLNRNFTLGMIPSLNDFYDFLGLSRTKEGDSIGWTNSDGSYYWIDFNHYKITLESGIDCWVIESVFLPDASFMDDL